MKNNPILNFRFLQKESVVKKDSDKTQFKDAGLKNQATMITKSREAIDSSEISMTYESMQDTIHFEQK